MKRTFQAGEIVFREGEISLTVYVVQSGEVELCKMGPRGMVVLATLGKGEMFGEMGVLDKTPRSATALAATDLEVEIIPRSEFLHDLETKPGMQLKVLRKLIDRLRAADMMLAQLGGVEGKAGESLPLPSQPKAEGRKASSGGLLRRLFGLVKTRSPSPSQPLPKENAGPLVILLANIFGDYEGGLTVKKIQAALEALPSCVARPVNAYVPAPGTVDGIPAGEQLPAAIDQGRKLLAKNNGDLLIWGEVDPDGRLLELRFLPQVNDDRAGAFSPEIPLDLPFEFEEGWINLLRASVLAALEPRTEAHVTALRSALATEVAQAAAVVESSRGFMSAGEQATVYIAYANANAAAGNMDQGPDLYHAAIENYRRAIRFLTEQVSRTLGLVQRQLGLSLQAAGERFGDPDLLERAADTYRAACQSITREDSPREWALIQNRLGVLLYRLDLKTGRNEPLRESLAAFQGALQVITRADEPFRWAEIMNNLAQALQVYGEHVKSPNALERAVEACRVACEVRTQDVAPLLWAATQNNMGSALFLLARHSKNSDHARQAAEAFRGALGIYEIQGATKLASVAEKNLARASELYQSQSRRRVVQPVWADDGTPEDAPPLTGE
ncbi:MAG: cyclic nucleotide-binding domain-containing protein [Alphaproteobacteria bacterium]|nr:cyclic nucleotide-binding domain-containing protein [Alphaproteobacteria bacterium]MBF0130063.1 cyclic nucleotide-binding domain-containing protein [Alphaproteobacteria bacterium]